MKKWFHTLLSIAVVISTLPGCAAMFHGTSQQINVRSNDPDASLYVNEAFIGKGVGAVTVLKKKNDYTIAAKKEGCTTNQVPVAKSFDAITLLGILIDLGIVSVLVVDGAATGAWQQFDQTSFVVDPVCDGKKL
jgi:hypothetical protein